LKINFLLVSLNVFSEVILLKWVSIYLKQLKFISNRRKIVNK
jgi:hypothetical protein